MRHGNAEAYRVFTRTWWHRNPSWVGGREPEAGRKHTLAVNCTEDEARGICQRWNAAHDPGFLSRKAEYERM
jgi:hypothetical protein